MLAGGGDLLLHESQGGQGLVAAMRCVPPPFFQEAFSLDQAPLWEQLVQVRWAPGVVALVGADWARLYGCGADARPVGAPENMARRCPLYLLQVHSEEARNESLERLSGHLDVVETHLVREIAARTGERTNWWRLLFHPPVHARSRLASLLARRFCL